MTTNEKCKVQIVLPELHENIVIEYSVHVIKDMQTYDMIIGTVLIQELCIIIDFGKHLVTWDDAQLPMKDHAELYDNSLVMQKPLDEDAEISQIKIILHTKYEATDLDEVVAECSHLELDEQQALRQVLEKYKDLFDGSLGHWTGDEYNIDILPEANPYHAKAYPVPKAYDKTI